MDVANLSIVDACCKPLQLCKQLPLSFEEDQKPTKRCSKCALVKSIDDFVKSKSQCKKCRSEKIMECMRRRRGYGKIREKIILRQCQFCGKKVKTRDFNQRRNACLECALKERKKGKKKPLCVQCGKPCSRQGKRFCSFSCFNENRSFGIVSLVCGGCGGEFTRKVRLAKLYKSHACSLNCAKILNVRKALDRKKTAIKKEWKNSNHKLRLQKWIERHEFSQWFKKCKGQRLGGKEEGSGWKVKCASATKTLQGRSITNRLNLSDEIKPLSWRQHATKRLGWVSLKVKRQKNQWSLRCYNTRKMMKDRAFKKS